MLKHVDAPVTAPKPAGAPDSQTGQNTCAECGRVIVGVFCRIGDKNFHAECFRCATCGNSLKNVGHFNINDKLYCDVHAPQAAKIANRSSVYEPLAVNLYVYHLSKLMIGNLMIYYHEIGIVASHRMSIRGSPRFSSSEPLLSLSRQEGYHQVLFKQFLRNHGM